MYDVIINADTNNREEIASDILKRIMRSNAKPHPIKDASEACDILKKAYFRIYDAIYDIYPEICMDKLILYVFDHEEGKKGTEGTLSGGTCSRFKDGAYAIGICETALEDHDKLIYYLLHEISHLRYFEHSPRFYAVLDVLLLIYNRKTGENISNQYERKKRGACGCE